MKRANGDGKSTERNIKNSMEVSRRAITPINKDRRRNYFKKENLDSYMTDLAMSRTIGEVMKMRDVSLNARTYFVTNLISMAILERDISAIVQIVNRIDGLVPDRERRDQFANYFGDALDDVMNYENKDQLRIYPDDLTIIALAKIVYHLSIQQAVSLAGRKDRAVAIEMVLTRTGGKITEPTRISLDAKYVKPDWMTQITDGGDDGNDRG